MTGNARKNYLVVLADGVNTQGPGECHFSLSKT